MSKVAKAASEGPAPGPGSRRLSRWLPIAGLGLVIFGAAAALYAPSLRYPFVFDDIHNIAENPSIRITGLSPQEILGATGETYSVESTRPIAFYTFALNYYFGGLDPAGYRLVNMIIHGLNALLVGLLAFTLTSGGRSAASSLLVSSGTALLWAVHPVQSSAVVYIVQRMTSLATLFYLLAFLFYILGRRGRHKILFVPCVLFYLLACMSKEIAFILPLLIVLYEVSFSPGFRQWVQGKRLLAVAVPVLGLAAFAVTIYAFRETYAVRGFTWQERLLTEARVVARYLALLAFPHPSRLLADYSAYPLSKGFLLPPSTLWSALLHLTAVGLGVFFTASRPRLGFTILGFYGHLVMESTVLPLRIAYEHRLYLPSVFLALGLAFAVTHVLGRREVWKAMLFLAVGAAAAVAWTHWSRERTEVWKDPVVFWGDVVRKAPGNARAHGGLGAEYFRRGEHALARRHLARAVELDAKDWRSMLNLGLVETQTGNHREALAYLRLVLESGYRNPQVFYNMGIVLWRLGERPAAIENLAAALQFDRRFPEINFYIATIYYEMGDLERAGEHLRRELLVNPAHPGARQLGNLLGRRQRSP